MDDNLINTLQRVRDKRTHELSRAEARALLQAGLAQRVGGFLTITAKGRAILANSGQAGG